MINDRSGEFQARLDLTRQDNPHLELRLVNWGQWNRGRIVEMVAIKTPAIWSLPGIHDPNIEETAPEEPKPYVNSTDAEKIAAVVCKPEFKQEWRDILHIAYVVRVPDYLLSSKARTNPEHFIDLFRAARREIARKA